MGRRSVGVLFDEQRVVGCPSTLSWRISSFTNGNCRSTSRRSGAAVLAQMYELWLDQVTLPGRWNDG
jgi:hypothetical protein